MEDPTIVDSFYYGLPGLSDVLLGVLCNGEIDNPEVFTHATIFQERFECICKTGDESQIDIVLKYVGARFLITRVVRQPYRWHFSKTMNR